jgi:hypothetical protein
MISNDIMGRDLGDPEVFNRDDMIKCFDVMWDRYFKIGKTIYL